MGLWSRLHPRIEKATHAVAGAARKAVNALEEVASDLVETAGNAAQDGLGGLADLVEDARAIGRPAGAGLRWVGGVVSGALDLSGAVIKGSLGLVSGVLDGIVRVVGGVLSLDGDLVRRGALGIVSGILGPVVVVLGEAASFLHVVLLLQAPKRRLTGEEIGLLRRVFRDSIALYNVRLVEGRAGIFHATRRPFTLGNTVYLKGRSVGREPELLVHEATHVWQYQRLGAWYATDALGAQLAYGPGAYSWEEEIRRGREEWEDFNREAQGRFLEDLYTHGELLASAAPVRRGGGAFYDADGRKNEGRFVFHRVNHTERANRALAVVRGARSILLS